MSFVSELVKSFTGDSQRDDLARADAERADALRRGRRQAIGTQNEFLDRSTDFLQGDIDAGGSALEQALAALGLSGRGAQTSFARNFEDDPGFAAEQQAGIDALDQSAAAKGELFSGEQLKAVSDFGQRHKRSAFQDRIAQFLNLAGRGSGASSQAAGLTDATGRNIADIEFGSGQLDANAAVNSGNVRAQSRSIPLNNLLSIARAAAKVIPGAAAATAGA